MGCACNVSLQMLQEADKFWDKAGAFSALWHCLKDHLAMVSYLDLLYVQI